MTETSKPVADDSISVTASSKGESPLIFISHDSRDADLAEAFANLLLDASGGILKSFRSSDRKGTAGIEFGAEWYRTIMDKLDDATDVVALLTERSLNRPWILYETGVAKGKLGTTVLGLALGVQLGKVSTGPFAQFQNSDDDEDSITKLVLQLIRRHPQATPREEAVRRQVQAFLHDIKSLLQDREVSSAGSSDASQIGIPDENPIAKLFEEVKVLVRGMPERVVKELDGAPRKQHRTRNHNPRYIFELSHMFPDSENSVGLLIALSLLRDDIPWMYDLGVEYYRAQLGGNTEVIDRAFRQFKLALDYAVQGFGPSRLNDNPDTHEMLMFVRHILLERNELPRTSTKTTQRNRSNANESEVNG